MAELSRDFEKKILDEVLCPEPTDTLGVVDEGVDGEEGVEGDEEMEDSLLGSGTGLFPRLIVLVISLLA